MPYPPTPLPAAHLRPASCSISGFSCLYITKYGARAWFAACLVHLRALLCVSTYLKGPSPRRTPPRACLAWFDVIQTYNACTRILAIFARPPVCTLPADAAALSKLGFRFQTAPTHGSRRYGHTNLRSAALICACAFSVHTHPDPPLSTHCPSCIAVSAPLASNYPTGRVPVHAAPRAVPAWYKVLH